MDINLKFLKPKKRFTKRGSHIRPHLYWRYILVITFIITLSSCAFGWYMFMKVEKTTELPALDVDNQNTIQRDRIEKALLYFQEKKENSLEILNSPAPFIDPSI